MAPIAALRHGGATAWGLVLGFLLSAAASVELVTRTVELRYERDVHRMVFNDNLELLDEIRARVGASDDSLKALVGKRSTTPAGGDQPYLVVSLEDHMLWYKQGSQVLFSAPVATGSGKELVGTGTNSRWRFETPRGRLAVKGKDENPAWVPPDWHFEEQARKKGVGIVRLERSKPIPLGNGAELAVEGSEVVRRYPDGRRQSLGEGKEGREVVVGGKLVVPPFGTSQRRYMGVLGTRRLNLGDGYGIHGTDNPASIGRSVSHGCIRMKNEDIERLYPMIEIGTPVFIY